jgi:hypothetical protein
MVADDMEHTEVDAGDGGWLNCFGLTVVSGSRRAPAWLRTLGVRGWSNVGVLLAQRRQQERSEERRLEQRERERYEERGCFTSSMGCGRG